MLKDKQKILKNELLDIMPEICTLLRIGQVYYWSKSTSYCTISFFTFRYVFRICLVIWYDLFPTYLVENNFSKMNLFFFYHKMVNVKYCKVQISNELSCFNTGSMRQGDHFSQTKKKVGETGNWYNWLSINTRYD